MTRSLNSAEASLRDRSMVHCPKKIVAGIHDLREQASDYGQ